MNKKIDLYLEAKTALMILSIADFNPILQELNLFGVQHLRFLEKSGLIDKTMEVITVEGLFYVELIKKELTNIKTFSDDRDIIKLEKHLGSHLKTYLIVLYFLGEASDSSPALIHTPMSYLDILVRYGLVTDFSYELTPKGLQVLRQIGKKLEITADKAEIQQLVDNLSSWEALTLRSVSQQAVHHKTILPYHTSLVDKGLITHDQNHITKRGLRVLIRYSDIHTRQLWKLLNNS